MHGCQGISCELFCTFMCCSNDSLLPAAGFAECIDMSAMLRPLRPVRPGCRRLRPESHCNPLHKALEWLRTNDVFPRSRVPTL
jgi:hypothetical protein